MKKKLFNLLALAAMIFAVGSLAVSCSGDEPNPDTPINNGGGGNNNGGGGNEEPIVIGENPTEKYQVPTPIDCQAMKATPTSANGATIEVTGVSNNNFVFDVTPGTGMQSYRLDCYPLGHLYNSLYERMKSEGKTSCTKEETAQYIRDMVFNGTGSGGYTFSPDQHEDYAKKTFDWAGSSYAQFVVLPGAEYIIIAIGCFDQGGTEAAEMTVCYVNTPEEALVGNPDLEIKVTTSYVGWKVSYVDNEDCKYISNWETDRSDFEPYIEAYGSDLFIDWLRHTYQSGPQNVATWEENYQEDYYVMRAGFVGVPSTHEFMACAVAMDENGTAAKEYRSAIFTLEEKPETDAAEATLTIDQVGSQSFIYTWDMDKTCYAGVWRIMTLAEYEQYKDADEETLNALAADIYGNGIGQNNYNYMWDKENAEAIGDGIVISNDFAGCRPGETYVLAYTARNAIVEYMTTKFTEPFTMDTLVKDAPDTCESDCTLRFEATGRESLLFEFDYTWETTAMIHWQLIDPTQETPSDEYLTEYLLETHTLGNFSGTSGAECNHFSGYEADSKRTELFGYEPNTTYRIAWITEDWNGVVSKVHVQEAKTEGITYGGDPQVTLTPSTTADGRTSVAVWVNTDCHTLMHVAGTEEMTELEIRYLKKGLYDPAHYLKAWYNYVFEYGLASASAPSLETMANSIEGKDFVVMVFIPKGLDAEGNECVGDMQYLIYDNGTWKTLEDFFPEE